MKEVNFNVAKENFDKIDFAEVVTNCMNKCPWMSGGFARASMDLITGEVYYESGVGSTWTEFENPTTALYSCNNINTLEGYNPEDLLDEDEFPSDDSDTWDVIRNLPNLRERMIEASIQFYDIPDYAKNNAFRTLEEMELDFEYAQ